MPLEIFFPMSWSAEDTLFWLMARGYFHIVGGSGIMVQLSFTDEPNNFWGM